ncbi:hypothetical protein THIAE_06030 [Thiomicrospira aerophila AL3]|uniref:Uncharacterized protein n=1 Tax=Thiomicrospira aerophila AL3 TaxID=717772 RepID=W0DZK7_9GAMM|nr:hypothetical protein [Thiomicrospira aerophila]AHF02281.1 hypothetical protein THIAE_06030 [Thiomicrospira aerophila AL3]
MNKKTYLPVWEPIDLLQGGHKEAYFEAKLNDDGSHSYRLLECDMDTLVEVNGELVRGLKPTKKWLTESEFNRRWITNHLCKRNLAVVELAGPLIGKLVDLYDRRIGGQWRSTYNTCKHNTMMLFINQYGLDEHRAKLLAITICRGECSFENIVFEYSLEKKG